MVAASSKTAHPELVEGLSFSGDKAAGKGQSFDKLRTNGTRGKITPSAPLSPLVWFKSGGPAQTLFEPADVDVSERNLEVATDGGGELVARVPREDPAWIHGVTLLV